MCRVFSCIVGRGCILQSIYKIEYKKLEIVGFQLKESVKVKVAQSCPTLCYPLEYTVRGILQARKLEWVAFPFSRDLPNPGIKSRSPSLQADSFFF